MIHLNEVRRSSVDIQVQISELIAFSCCCMKQFLLSVMTCEAHDVSLGGKLKVSIPIMPHTETTEQYPCSEHRKRAGLQSDTKEEGMYSNRHPRATYGNVDGEKKPGSGKSGLVTLTSSLYTAFVIRAFLIYKTQLPLTFPTPLSTNVTRTLKRILLYTP